MTTKFYVKRLHTTVGELIAAIMDAAERITSERFAYQLTALLLNRMLQPVPVAVTQVKRVRRKN